MQSSELLEYGLLAAVIAIGWFAGRMVVDTAAYWINVGLSELKRLHWERANPEMAAALKAHQKRQRDAFLAPPADADVAPLGTHGQYH